MSTAETSLEPGFTTSGDQLL